MQLYIEYVYLCVRVTHLTLAIFNHKTLSYSTQAQAQAQPRRVEANTFAYF